MHRPQTDVKPGASQPSAACAKRGTADSETDFKARDECCVEFFGVWVQCVDEIGGLPGKGPQDGGRLLRAACTANQRLVFENCPCHAVVQDNMVWVFQYTVLDGGM